MKCPSCGYHDTKVIDSRLNAADNSVKRRRECLRCSYRFTTHERFEEQHLVVRKADGSWEPFDRDKISRGVMIACTKRPISSQQITALIDDIELTAKLDKSSEIQSKKLGDMVLERLRLLDDVAYIRFASVYKDFKNVEEFVEAVKKIG